MSSNTNSTPTYLDIRAAGRSMVTKIHDSPYIKDYSIIKAAKKLTIPMP